MNWGKFGSAAQKIRWAIYIKEDGHILGNGISQSFMLSLKT